MKPASARRLLSAASEAASRRPAHRHLAFRPPVPPQTCAAGTHRYHHTPQRRGDSSLAYQQPEASSSQIEQSEPIYQPKRTSNSTQGTEETTPLEEYKKLIDTGRLKGDEHQTRIIQKLQRLHDDLLTYEPPPVPPEPSPSIFSKLLSKPSRADEPLIDPAAVPRGLYLYGDVGTGKTMLMDLFYSALPSRLKTRARRVHFHAFMIDVHKRVHKVNVSRGYVGSDQVGVVAREIARETSVLCFDEFQVTDITDAMILGRLIESLLNFGVVCVFTSNRHPDDLYKNGIQRSSFIPTIELLKARFDVTDLDSGTDYRRMPRALSQVYYAPLNDATRREIEKLFASLTQDEEVVRNRALNFWGRTLYVPESSSKVAKFTFHDLCQKPLSAADYLEVTRAFGTVFVTDVPKMGWSDRDKARRFITFIDACYESKTKLFVSSEVPIFKIFSDESKDGGSRPISHHMRSMMDDLGLPSDVVGSSSLFTVDEEIFAFARACSRLVQMGSKEWAETAGRH